MIIEKRLIEIEEELRKIQNEKEQRKTRKLEIRNTLLNDQQADLELLKEELDQIEQADNDTNQKIAALEEERKNLQNKLDTAKSIFESEVRTLRKPNEEEKNMQNIYETLEYRKAFKDYVLRGTSIPKEFRDATIDATITEDVGAVIPTTLVAQIIEKLKFYGNIFSRVTITNYKGGVEIPVSDTKPTAVWTSEGTVASKQKKTVSGKVIFAYHKLQVRVAVTLEAETTTLPVFEQTLVDNIYEAMIIAIEDAIINGDGNGKPLGILNSWNSNIPSSQKIVVKPSEIGSWEKWSKVFAKIPLAKRNGVSIILNNETFEGNIIGAVDQVGQPIARVNYGINGQETYSLKGKEVIPVEDYLPAFDAASTNEIFGIIVNLRDYIINSNLQLTYRRYFDEDTDEWVHKATAILDGKLADTQGVLLLVKGSDAQ